MTTRRDVNLGILSTIAAATATEAFAQMPHTIELPPPVTEGGKSLMQSLKDRRSIRDYSIGTFTNYKPPVAAWASSA